MSNLHKKIEILSNLAIIAIAILLSSVLIKKYFWLTQADTETKKRNSSVHVNSEANIVGRRISLPNIDWAGNRWNLVLAIHSKCHFCTESAPFYKELTNKLLAQPNLQIVAVSSEPPHIAKAYLDSLGVSIDKVRQADFRPVGVTGTPTLLMVDNNGIVTSTWIGRLDSNREAEVLARLQ